MVRISRTLIAATANLLALVRVLVLLVDCSAVEDGTEEDRAIEDEGEADEADEEEMLGIL